MFPVTSTGSNPYQITTILNGMPVPMDVDTGAALTTVFNQLTYERLLEHAGQESRMYIPVSCCPQGKLQGTLLPVLGTMQR